MESIGYEKGGKNPLFCVNLCQHSSGTANGTKIEQVENRFGYLSAKYLSDDDIMAQVRFEAGAYTEAVERFTELKQGSNSVLQRHTQSLQVKLIEALTKAIEERQDEAALAEIYKSGSAPSWYGPLLALDANKLAFITLNCALRGAIDGAGEKRKCTLRNIIINIYESVKEQIDYENYIGNPGVELKSLQDSIKRFKSKYYKKLDAKRWRWWQSKLHIQHSDWNKTNCFGLGAALIDVLLKGLPQYFTKIYGVADTNKRSLELHITDELRDMMQSHLENYAFGRPRYMPMMIPPRDWSYDKRGRLVGGYYLHDVNAITSTMNKHTAALDKPMSVEDIEAMNFAQRTAWNINDRVYNAAVVEIEHKNNCIHPVNAAASGLPDPRVSTRLF